MDQEKIKKQALLKAYKDCFDLVLKDESALTKKEAILDQISAKAKEIEESLDCLERRIAKELSRHLYHIDLSREEWINSATEIIQSFNPKS